ncbi:G-type lectin S-receptor-like serine/threonine-protein kinase At1g11300 isoform X1 [Papaver somniferum]|uniref:G-type lectin S-receptor-like serine/threonine-protein kinase At1g11300 isoform X1 n=2 Tax=Papaver somniferum TaxID=3469 RepID=UPI000E6FC8CF|nr:G-type lectin S-receptor-like serine/threonine-protein kinase At1g11300 isoform X1 [Papaver somniferum]
MGIERRRNIKLILPCLFTLLSFLIGYYISDALDISDHQTVVSSGGKFRLGFFSLKNSSTNRYAGIWFNNIPGPTIIWVANQDKPLNDSSGVLKIADDGNLVVSDGRKNILWTSGLLSNASVVDTEAELMDTGNLVLREKTSDNSSGRILWESFDYASNVLLPGMKVGENIKPGLKGEITSWRDSSDPSTGIFSLELDPSKLPQIIIKNVSKDKLHWRSGPWNNRVFIGVPRMYSVYVDGFFLVRDGQQVYLTLGYGNKTSFTRFVLEPDGMFVQRDWLENNREWVDVWHSQETECDIYGKCGPFGSCNALDSPICSCLQGFEPKSKDEWSNGNWLGGCVRRTELQCHTNNNAISTGEVRKELDGFLKLDKMKVPDHVEWWESQSTKECEQNCLNNCSCLAYSYENNIGCMWWASDMLDIQKFGNFSKAGVQLHIKVAYSELPKKKDARLIISIAIIIGIAVVGLCTFICWRWMAKQRGEKQKGAELYLLDSCGETSDANMFGDNKGLVMFHFETLAMATNNFSEASKLGHGGFGSVYKANLVNGQVVAVKRLAKGSGQGLEEFKNEVLVISKLQHRNLVRLLGCCTEREEKILVYEYMPNKSLDAFLFVPTQRTLLDWRKRFHIIEGITRGILYLHRDSRLRVIHRDLKASNVLLDEKLNPKISDFGMARIFGGDELQADTRRVVGTYGYMSPEYAMEGRFSEKSDVFSFGVLLLEIVSGKKNTSFHLQELSLSLLGYAWKLWKESMAQALIDPTLLSEQKFEADILRCIHVGLLCVQESAKYRPTMSIVLSMLTSEIVNLPTPERPAFIEREVSSPSCASFDTPKPFSVNNVTITSIEGS